MGIARGAIAQALGLNGAIRPIEPWLRKPRANFVTLMHRGELRGCIGSLTARQPLVDDLAMNARHAAFQDPRFAPLGTHEFAELRVEISLLGRPSPLLFRDQAHALAQLRPFVDGVILEYGRHRGTFLPQVWAHLPEPSDFFRHLKVKAGLSADLWTEDIRLFRYRARKFSEPMNDDPYE